jgi:hypothetical protein
MTKIMLSAAIAASGSIMSLMNPAGAQSNSELGYGMDDHMLRDLGLTRFEVSHDLPAAAREPRP